MDRDEEHGGRAAQIRTSQGEVIIFNDRTIAPADAGAPITGTLSDDVFEKAVALYDKGMKPIIKSFEQMRKQGIGGNPYMAYIDAGPLDSELGAYTKHDAHDHGGRVAQLTTTNGDAVVVFGDGHVGVHVKGQARGLTISDEPMSAGDIAAVKKQYNKEMEPIIEWFEDLRKKGIGGNPYMNYPQAGPVEPLLAPFANKARAEQTGDKTPN